MSDSILDFIPRPGFARFFQDAQRKIVRYLISHYHVSEDMANEAFCEGCHTLLDRIHDGRLTAESLNSDTNTTLEKYLFVCCRNNLLKTIKRNKIIADNPPEEEPVYIQASGKQESEETEQHEMDLSLMEKIVLDLPTQCHDLIFGKYYNRLSLAELAEELNYGSSRVAITTLSRCIKKVRDRFKKERTYR